MTSRFSNQLAGALVPALALLTVPLHAQAVHGSFRGHHAFVGESEGQYLGEFVALAGDVDGDGVSDVIVTGGDTLVYSGSDGRMLWQFLGGPAAAAGDVNQDGFADVIVGAFQAHPGGRQWAGSAFVYSGADGTVLWQFDGEEAYDGLGYSVAGAGDVNQDGFADLVVGANDKALVFSGEDGAMLWKVGADSQPQVAGAGDVNADGFDDVIVGEPDSGPNLGGGSACVYSGDDGTLLWWSGYGERYSQLGWSVAGAGDVNNDGYADVIVGALEGEPFFGSASVYSGKEWTVIWKFRGANSGDRLGQSVAAAGDVNRDGFADVIVGAPYADPDGKESAGSAYVYSGMDGSTIWQFDGAEPQDGLGWSVAAAGDPNQDGFADIIIGSPRVDSVAEADSGSATIHVYNPAGLVHYGTGVPGIANITPLIGTGGQQPRIGNTEFQIEVRLALGVTECLIAGSLERTETPWFGLTFYGNYLTPGKFASWQFITTGIPFWPGTGTATLPLPIPNDPSLIGSVTYWQGLVMDPGSPSPLGLSQTAGLAVAIGW